MTEQERLDKINQNAGKHLEDYLKQIENEEITSDDLLSIVHGGMIAAGLMGFSPEALVDDARSAINKIIKLAEEHENV